MARDNQLPELDENNESDPLSWTMIGIGIILCYLVLSIATGGIVYAAFSPKLASTNSTLFTKLSDFVDLGTSYVLNKTKPKPNQPPVLNINWTMQLYEKTNWTCPDNKGSCLKITLNVTDCVQINPHRPILQANQACLPQPKPPCIPQPWPNATSCRTVITPKHPGKRREKCCSDESCYKPSKPTDSVVKTCEYPICKKVEPTKFTIEDFRNSPFLGEHSWYYWLSLFERYSPERLEVVTTLMERTVEELNRATMSHRCESIISSGYYYTQENCQICKNRYTYIDCVMNSDLKKFEPELKGPELKVKLFSLDELKRIERSVIKVIYGPRDDDLHELYPFFETFELLKNASKVVTVDEKGNLGKICQLCEYDLAKTITDIWEHKGLFNRCYQIGKK